MQLSEDIYPQPGEKDERTFRILPFSALADGNHGGRSTTHTFPSTLGPDSVRVSSLF